jgi:inorganic triphosphatase YgiF
MTFIPEVALKLVSTPNEMPHLKQSLLEMATHAHPTCHKSFDTFFDTANDKLRRGGLAFW